MLLAVVAHVLRAAAPDAPETVTQRAYDAARASAGHSASPRADKLVASFGVSWPRLRAIALTSANPGHSVAQAARQHRRRVLTLPEAISAVRRAASALDADELTAASYEDARRALDERGRRRHRHGRHLTPMPSADVIHHAHGFARVVQAAGLRTPDTTYAPSLPRAEAVLVFLEAFGFLPRSNDLDWFGREYGIQLANKRAISHADSIEQARAAATSQGRWFPVDVPRGRRPTDWQTTPVDAARIEHLAAVYPRKRTAGQAFTLDDLRAGIAAAFDLVEPGERVTVSRYKALARVHGLPNYGTLHERAKEHETTFPKLAHEEAERRSRAAGIPADAD
ncbi:hypothetical protein GKE82_00590 [Conexibacter sp. W3-3-2]|uniref:hypothetical protein n=1 Tax=Conexibacter sp. W3-3-2 TaxID=2675227 RepID=UPI0012B95924|nr:hypothetical protein [Conexibacter sp. W3-3-2]MTD42839.1 hypothetical protein [Conexibacter sp. W3-3-2]